VRLAGRGALILFSALAVGCPARPAKVVVFDFVERLPVADLWSERETLLFGTPATEPHQVVGFYRVAGAPAGDSFLMLST
jgi:hypothetical protein